VAHPPIAEPREGEILRFGIYPNWGSEFTLGNPETIIWSSIHHLCSRSAAEYYARVAHGISNKRDRRAVAENIKLYIHQASEFYQAAASAKPNTAPLIYYYSFLNLAKAFCEIRKPRFHQRKECYAHGLGWRPSRTRVVNPWSERVTIGTRGVWHALWEALTGRVCPAADGVRLPVRKLFSYCPEVSAEYLSIFSGATPTVDLVAPGVVYNKTKREAWLRFSLRRADLKAHGLHVPALLRQTKTVHSAFFEVRSVDTSLRLFESETAKAMGPDDDPWTAVRADVSALNVISMYGDTPNLSYAIPIQGSLPISLPQLLVSYTTLFWLGSLVRYDPHSVHRLMDSEFWVLIDGFMSQSRPWLLELFQWALYQREITLRTAR